MHHPDHIQRLTAIIKKGSGGIGQVAVADIGPNRATNCSQEVTRTALFIGPFSATPIMAQMEVEICFT